MKEMIRLVASTILGTCVLAGGRADAQVFEKGPYYPYPSWDQQLPASTRFIVLTNWGSQAVLDRETGLVWERAPFPIGSSWQDALLDCHTSVIGGRLGWRLPTVEEFATLPDPTQSKSPQLPAGHPFVVGADEEFWTASTFEPVPTHVYAINFGLSGVSVANEDINVAQLTRWCVRGGSGAQNPLPGAP